MAKVFLEKYEAICAAGNNVEEIISQIDKGETLLQLKDFSFDEKYTYPVGAFKKNSLSHLDRYHLFFEKLCLQHLEALNVDLSDKSTLLLIATTKGNIQLLEKNENVSLHLICKNIQAFSKAYHQPKIISNACISGSAALIYAHDLIKLNKFEKVVVFAADFISDFVVSGFHSFQALSSKPCKPYDNDRNGLSIGEAAAMVVVSGKESQIEILGGATSNDANHVSGPSREGSGLRLAISKAMQFANIDKIDFINAHGTATNYNDEMESIAFNILKMNKIPLNSFKGYFGHTLGAAGLLETILSAEMMKLNTAFKTCGYENLGISNALNIVKDHKNIEINTLLKTASGFGGSNAAIILKNNG